MVRKGLFEFFALLVNLVNGILLNLKAEIFVHTNIRRFYFRDHTPNNENKFAVNYQNRLHRKICVCVLLSQSSSCVYIVGTPPLSAGRGGAGLSLQPNFQKGGASQDLNFYRGVAEKEGVTFFRRGAGCNFHIKIN